MKISEKLIKKSNYDGFLEITIVDHFLISQQVLNIIKQISVATRMTCKLSAFVCYSIKIDLLHAFVYPKFTCTITAWGNILKVKRN